MNFESLSKPMTKRRKQIMAKRKMTDSAVSNQDENLIKQDHHAIPDDVRNKILDMNRNEKAKRMTKRPQ